MKNKNNIVKKMLGLTLGLFLTMATYANGIVTYKDATTAKEAKTEGVFNFTFDSEFKIEDINSTAKYYTNYFTVSPVKTEGGMTVTIKLIEDNEMARRVVKRFFVSLEVKEVIVNGESIDIDKFITTYVMN